MLWNYHFTLLLFHLNIVNPSSSIHLILPQLLKLYKILTHNLILNPLQGRRIHNKTGTKYCTSTRQSIKYIEEIRVSNSGAVWFYLHTISSKRPLLKCAKSSCKRTEMAISSGFLLKQLMLPYFSITVCIK